MAREDGSDAAPGPFRVSRRRLSGARRHVRYGSVVIRRREPSLRHPRRLS